jgi:hypothetical protein
VRTPPRCARDARRPEARTPHGLEIAGEHWIEERLCRLRDLVEGGPGELVRARHRGIRCLPQLCEDSVWRVHHAEVDVLGGACPLEAKLEDETALEGRCVAEHGGDTREEALEHEELPLARELGAGLRGRSEALLESLLERLG